MVSATISPNGPNLYFYLGGYAILNTDINAGGKSLIFSWFDFNTSGCKVPYIGIIVNFYSFDA